MRNTISLLFAVVLISGCASISQVTAPNRQNLMKLSIGMRKDEVISIMGTKTFHLIENLGMDGGGLKKFTINNPYRSEILDWRKKEYKRN